MIFNIDQLVPIIREIKKGDQKVVLCHGVFDLVHFGHLRHLKAAKEFGDILIVSLTTDKHIRKGPGRPIFNQDQRAEFVSSLDCVDFVTYSDAERVTDVILKIRPDFYVKGQDYSNDEKDLTGGIVEEREAIESVGGRLVCTDEIAFSSSSLINRWMDAYPKGVASYLSKFRGYHTPDEIINILDSFKELKVLVIGEEIFDEYIYCKVLGKPAKASVLSVQVTETELFCGGALAVVDHLTSFVKEVYLLTHTSRPPIQKTRFLDEDFHYKLFEYTDALTEPLSDDVVEDLKVEYDSLWKRFDMVLVSDYGHDLLADPLVQTITQNHKFLAVNAQTNSLNQGYNLITKYPKANFVCIDRPELRLAVSDRYGYLHHLLLKLRNLIEVDTIALTCGPDGCIVNRDHYMNETPAFSDYVVDTMGAGDAFYAITSLCALKGVDPEIIGFIGNAVGAIGVSTLGQKPIEYVELCKYITRLLK